MSVAGAKAAISGPDGRKPDMSLRAQQEVGKAACSQNRNFPGSHELSSICSARWTFRVLGQVVGDIVPSRLIAHENMVDGFDFWVVIQ